jgi:hypothetical protein
VVGPAVTGYLVQASGAFTSAFVLAGGIAVLGAALVAFLVRPIRQLDQVMLGMADRSRIAQAIKKPPDPAWRPRCGIVRPRALDMRRQP